MQEKSNKNHFHATINAATINATFILRKKWQKKRFGPSLRPAKTQVSLGILAGLRLYSPKCLNRWSCGTSSYNVLRRGQSPYSFDEQNERVINRIF